MLIKNSVLFILFCLIVEVSFSQNLVLNPSFEEKQKCPVEMGNISSDVLNWGRASRGTTDYFNVCSEKMSTTNNFNGSQESDFGEGYAGLYLMAPNNYREYLQGQLSGPLKKGATYSISFYISLADNSRYAIKDIGVLFSKKRLSESTKQQIKFSALKNSINQYNFKSVKGPSYVVNKSGWVRVHSEFVANGSEEYLSIGNFKDNSSTDYVDIGQGKKSASYYYLDMVAVEELKNKIPYANLELNKTYVLENVLFPKDEYILNKEAKLGLKKLYKELKEDPSLYVTIHAHTDNDGTNNYNKVLSTNRAKSVASFLISLGLRESRLHWVGYGDDKPLVQNTTAEGRKRNRRAEFSLSKTPFNNNGTLTETLFEDDN